MNIPHKYIDKRTLNIYFASYLDISSIKKIKLTLFSLSTTSYGNRNRRSRLALFKQIQKENAVLDTTQTDENRIVFYG
jgi:hypothetical protein